MQMIEKTITIYNIKKSMYFQEDKNQKKKKYKDMNRQSLEVQVKRHKIMHTQIYTYY